MKDYTAKIKQDGIIVVQVNASTIEQTEKEISHYAMMYSQDGPIEIIRNYKLKQIKQKGSNGK